MPIAPYQVLFNSVQRFNCENETNKKTDFHPNSLAQGTIFGIKRILCPSLCLKLSPYQISSKSVH